MKPISNNDDIINDDEDDLGIALDSFGNDNERTNEIDLDNNDDDLDDDDFEYKGN